ncbi:transposable element Tcb2 transposase [Trichonephila clavipes]|nr:transposable element Tcb2 transposase [Trichonephila clavipes]
MLPRRKKEKLQQFTEFERGGLSAFEKDDFPIAQLELVCSGTVPQFASSEPTVTEQLEKLAVDYGRQWAARWSTAIGVLMPASSIRRRLLHRGLGARVPLYRIPLKANHRQPHLQWAPEHRAWQADSHQVVFQMNHASICESMIAAFALDAMPVNAAFHSALSNDILI